MYSLPTQLIGSRVYSFKEVDSTNQIAMILAEEGAPEGAVVVADRQHNGRGQRGRGWYSPPGVGIYLSIILKPRSVLATVHQLSLLAAVATAECIESATGLKAGIKWPNDVIINNHKVAGILVEAHWAEEIKYLILGIGINVNHTKDMFLTQGFPAATSMAIETGRECLREELLRELMLKLDHWHRIYQEDGFEPLWGRIQDMDRTPGGWVEVVSMGECFEGEALGIDKDASLLVRTGEIVRRVTQGRIRVSCDQLQHLNSTDSNITTPEQH